MKAPDLEHDVCRSAVVSVRGNLGILGNGSGVPDDGVAVFPLLVQLIPGSLQGVR